MAETGSDPASDGVAPPDADETTPGADVEQSPESTLEVLRRRIVRTLQMLRGSRISVEPYRPAEHGTLASYHVGEQYEEVDRYWVNPPYAFVVILYEPEANEHRYQVVEPDLEDHERTVLDMLFEDIRAPLIYRRDVTGENVEEILQEELRERLEEYGAKLGMNSFHKLYYYLHRAFRGYGKIDPLMKDSHIEDVSCDGYDLPIYVYHDDYADIETSVSFEQDELDNFVVRLAQQSGRHISIGDPIVGTTLPDGSRAEMALGREVTPRGSAFTIRQYAEEPFTPVDLLEYGTFNLDQMAYLWLVIENNKSLIFAGGTASGKTTSMNAVSMFIPPRSKVVTIEDTRELSLYHDNWLSAITREHIGDEGEDISMYELLRSSLRHRPEYIIVGEVRGEEAITLFQAMNTGHTTYSTMHADSVHTVINRLENEPINVPRPMVQSLDVLCVQTLTRFEDERVRRNKTLAEIEGIDQRTGELDYSRTFQWDATEDEFDQGNSQLLEEIRRERGWSRSELLEELDDRREVLEYLWDNGINDYRWFTATVNAYYADPEAVLDRVRTDASLSMPTME
jgi:flagellar protein FlaI